MAQINHATPPTEQPSLTTARIQPVFPHLSSLAHHHRQRPARRQVDGELETETSLVAPSTHARITVCVSTPYASDSLFFSSLSPPRQACSSIPCPLPESQCDRSLCKADHNPTYMHAVLYLPSTSSPPSSHPSHKKTHAHQLHAQQKTRTKINKKKVPR